MSELPFRRLGRIHGQCFHQQAESDCDGQKKVYVDNREAQDQS